MQYTLIIFSILFLAISIFFHFAQNNSLSSEEVISRTLNFYAKNNENMDKLPKNKKLAFGYVSDLDIVVNSLDLMKSIGIPSPPKPINLPSLKNLSDFVKTFTYFFKEGAGVEYFIENEDDFKSLVNHSIPLAKIKDLGGNAAVMALRAYQEKVEVLLGCSLDKYFYENLFGAKVKLVSPVEENMTDIHLVLDFFEGEKWGDLVSPRSNRFYLNHDKLNAKLALLEPFHLEVKKFSPNIIAIGGLHLLNDYSKEFIDDSFSKIGKHISIDKEIAKIHIEMGSFSNLKIIRSLVDNIFPHVI